MKLFLVSFLLLIAATRELTAQEAPTRNARPGLPTEATVLQTVRPGHPRLLLLSDDLARIKGYLSTDRTAQAYHTHLISEGEAMLAQPPVEHVLIGPRLLDKSRTALDRIYTLALLYRLDGDRKWADRAIQEMLAVSAFADWNPSHFLDVAEMTHAVAIGYDWLYDVLSPSERAAIRQAIVEHGLLRGQEAYRGTKPWKWWVTVGHNWNIVCNGGMIAGALAVADDDPELSRFILAHALGSLPRALASYAPDGAWAEGPGYWAYATDYAILTFGALQSALGTDYGLSTLPGLAEAGRFQLQTLGPTRLLFNFADAGEHSGDQPALFWLARRYQDPLLARGARAAAGRFASARDLLYYDPAGSPSELTHVPLDAHYAATNLAFLRSSWTDPDAVYVGFKGGDNKANHAHLDLGTFVMDALGQRWAMDLGSDNYNLPGYFGKQRFTYYRLSTAGHNTLMLNGRNQDAKAAAPLTAFGSDAEGSFAIADLSAGYVPMGATRVRRGIALRDGRSRVLIQDEVETAKPAEVVWGLHTQAAVMLEGAHATLTRSGQVLQAQILSPAGAVFGVQEVTFPPDQHPAPASGIRNLVIRLPSVTSARLVVLLTPGAGTGMPSPAIVPLAQWQATQKP